MQLDGHERGKWRFLHVLTGRDSCGILPIPLAQAYRARVRRDNGELVMANQAWCSRFRFDGGG